VRRLLLFTVLSLVATLVFAPAAFAQQSGPAFDFLEVPEGTPPCPLGLDEVKEIYGPNVTCGEGGGYVLTTSDSSTPPATSSPTSSGAPDVQVQVSQVGEGNIACVQTAVQQEFGKVQISQYGDNVNIQSISQECNISVTEVETVIEHASATVTATATATASATASASSAPAVQYQYAAPEVQYSASASSAPAAELPSTGGSSLIALGAGVLLVAGGLLARRIVR